MSTAADRLAGMGRRISMEIEGLGRFTDFTVATLQWLIRGAGQWGRVDLLIPQLYHIGTRSIPVIALVGGFIGMVLAVETYTQFAAIGQETRMGGLINISLVKQIGPVLAAVMLAGRVGGSVSAELGTMNVTEQLDAMRAMGADPVRHLVVPRVIACAVMIPVLTIFSDLVGILGGYLITVHGYGVNSAEYWAFSSQFVDLYSVGVGLTKSVFFGVSIGLISCYKGFYCRAGAKGVGRAATDAFVTSFMAIIILNFFLAKLLNDLYVLIYGPSRMTMVG